MDARPLVLGACLAAQLLLPATAPAQSLLAYESNAAGAYQVYRSAEDGRGVVQLTDNQCGSFSPDWSPDGTQIAHWRIDVGASGQCGPARLWVMGADGAGARPITPTHAGSDVWPDFAPDGRAIVFSSDRDARERELYLTTTAGAAPRRLTDNSVGDLFPSFAPDGRTILFVRTERIPAVGWPVQNVWAIDRDGSSERRMTLGGIFLGDPQFSPDGRRIAFSSLGRLFVMSVDGGDLRQITPGEPGFDVDLAWRPDGEALAFQRVMDRPDGTVHGLFVVDVASRAVTTVHPFGGPQFNALDYHASTRVPPARLGADETPPVVRVGAGDDIAATVPAPPAGSAGVAARRPRVTARRGRLNLLTVDRSGVRRVRAAIVGGDREPRYRRVRNTGDLTRMARRVEPGRYTLHVLATDVRGNRAHRTIRLRLR